MGLLTFKKNGCDYEMQGSLGARTDAGTPFLGMRTLVGPSGGDKPEAAKSPGPSLAQRNP